MDKRFWAIIGVIAVIFVGALWFSGKKNAKQETSTTTQPSSHLVGNKSSNIKLVEYGDFQCPYCGLYHPVVKQVIEKYKGQISFQFRNLPLQQVHENAFAAARAAEAADEQGKYWEMHDMIYENQQAWEKSKSAGTIFNNYAETLGLNTAQFKKDFASSKINNRILADRKAFDKTGNDLTTPTFLLNGKKIEPQATIESFSLFIDNALKTAADNKN